MSRWDLQALSLGACWGLLACCIIIVLVGTVGPVW